MTKVRSALYEAVATLLAALATLICTRAIDAETGPTVLAVVLCLSLSRSQLDRSLRGRIEAAVLLPLVSLAALGVAMLLRREPIAGAAAFTGAITASIWLRRFGPAGHKAGTLIALPFVVILMTPYSPPQHVGPVLALALPTIVALLALFWVSVVHALGQKLGVLQAAPARPPAPARAPSTMRPLPSTRMALQMGLALALSFAVGYGFFAERWAWIVLTAFIVNSGSQGRLDVLYKGILRLAGAAAGTVIALATAGLAADPLLSAALMLAAIFMAVWLRPLGYGWWALFITLALALLQGETLLLGLRLEEILIGALIGIGSAWSLLPLNSTDVLRRRIADALAALSEALDPARAGRSGAPFAAGLDGIAKLAPPFRALRLVTRRQRGTTVQAADWIDELAACREPALALIARGEPAPGAVRKALGAARMALREPPALGPALGELSRVLSGACAALPPNRSPSQHPRT